MEYKQITNDELNLLICEWQKQHKSLYSNFFGLQGFGSYEYFESEHTFVIRKRENDFYRLYLMSDNKEDAQSVLSKQGYSVFNIPTKKEIEEEFLNILSNAGYSLLATYQRMVKILGGDYEDFDGVFPSATDDTNIYNLLYSSFDPIVSYLPDMNKVKEMIEKKQILVNYDESNKINGLIMWSIEGKVCNFHGWVSSADAGSSLSLFINAHNYISINGIKRSNLWVNENNLSAKRIYEMLDYKYDGLKDYTFIKR